MLAEYPDTGCCIAGRTGRENRIERLVQGIGGSGLADPAGPEHASAAGAVPGGVLVGRGTLELAGMAVPAGGAAGAGSGSAEFLGVLQRAPGPLQKGKKSPGGLQLPPVMEGFFMKLQPESKKELKRILCGTAICTAAMWVLFAALHLVGWVRFDYTVVLASLVGAAVAIGNFAGICFVVQKVIDEQDEKRRKAQLQASYNIRMLIQAVWVIVAIGAPCFQPFAGILPLLFPRITIYYLQITGKYKPLAAPQEPVDVSVEDDPAPAPAQADGTRDEGGET